MAKVDLPYLAKSVEIAEENFLSEFQKTYPPGDPIGWVRNGRQFGTVLSYAYGRRLKVQSAYTLKIYFITMDDVLRAL